VKRKANEDATKEQWHCCDQVTQTFDFNNDEEKWFTIVVFIDSSTITTTTATATTNEASLVESSHLQGKAQVHSS